MVDIFDLVRQLNPQPTSTAPSYSSAPDNGYSYMLPSQPASNETYPQTNPYGGSAVDYSSYYTSPYSRYATPIAQGPGALMVNQYGEYYLPAEIDPFAVPEAPQIAAARGTGAWEPLLSSAVSENDLRFARAAGVNIPQYIENVAGRNQQLYNSGAAYMLPEEQAYIRAMDMQQNVMQMINSGIPPDAAIQLLSGRGELSMKDILATTQGGLPRGQTSNYGGYAPLPITSGAFQWSIPNYLANYMGGGNPSSTAGTWLGSGVSQPALPNSFSMPAVPWYSETSSAIKKLQEKTEKPSSWLTWA